MQARIEYVQDIWDYIAESPGDVPVSESHKQILAERLAEFDVSTDQGRPWSEVRKELLYQLRVS